MAKSFFEPKKIVRYQDSVLNPSTGLGSASTPALKPSATKVVPKVQAIPPAAAAVSAPAPAPAAPAVVVTPTPPSPPDYSRAFVFDGATELTSSFSTTGGSQLYTFTLASTITPAWSEETTGSFVIWSVSNPSDAADYRRTIGIERTSGSNGYEDKVFHAFSSGSHSIKNTKKLSVSPNFYSGSVENLFLEVYAGYSIAVIKENGITNRNTVTATGSAISDDLLQGMMRLLTPADTYTTSIGGYNSGSSGYFSGSINNLALSKGTGVFVGSRMPWSIENNRHVDLVYKFEENVNSSKGDSTLVVVGTETYVTSSL